MRCLLCSCDDVVVVSTQSVGKLVADWKASFKIDISAEMGHYDTFHLYECQRCGLQFFPPDLAGSGAFYSQLQTTVDWYYRPYRWEQDATLEEVSDGERLLEVGSGVGHFLEKLLARKNVSALGIELNPAAVDSAQKLGRPIILKSLDELGSEQPASFDVVCGFQVLEHVPDPANFLRSCLGLIKPGGRLIMAVPDSGGFIRLEPNPLLNQPPHHISRWSGAVLKNLTKYFPVKVHKIAYEPLAEYDLKYYVGLQFQRLPAVLRTTPAYSAVQSLARRLMRRTQLYRRLRGHTVCAIYWKLG